MTQEEHFKLLSCFIYFYLFIWNQPKYATHAVDMQWCGLIACDCNVADPGVPRGRAEPGEHQAFCEESAQAGKKNHTDWWSMIRMGYEVFYLGWS